MHLVEATKRNSIGNINVFAVRYVIIYWTIYGLKFIDLPYTSVRPLPITITSE